LLFCGEVRRIENVRLSTSDSYPLNEIQTQRLYQNHLQKSKGRKIDLRLWEIIVVDIDELTNKYPLSNHAVG